MSAAQQTPAHPHPQHLHALAFRDCDPLDERFEALAEVLYGPALDALQGEEEDA